MKTKTYIKKSPEQSILLASENYDIGLVKFEEKQIEVGNTDSLTVELKISDIVDNIEAGGGTPSIAKVLIDSLPEKDFLSIGGNRLVARQVLTPTQYNSMVYSASGVGIFYSSFKIRVIGTDALTDEWSESLEIIFNITGVVEEWQGTP